MPPEPTDPTLTLFAGGTIFLSIIACINVIHMRRQGPVLPYQPRRPVTWRWAGGILAMTYLLFTALSAFGGNGGEDAGTADTFSPWQTSGHPLIKMVMDAPPSPWVLVLAGIAAVIVAPICEEITFRLLLQGWL